MTDMNILDLFLKASLLVKLIMLILIGFSIASWAIIIQRTRILNAAGSKPKRLKISSGRVLSFLVCTRKARDAVITFQAPNKFSIAVSKSSLAYIALTAMRRKPW